MMSVTDHQHGTESGLAKKDDSASSSSSSSSEDKPASY